MKGSAVILPAGTLPTVDLDGDEFTLTIEIVTADEIPEILVVYPDGFKKWHQAKDLVELLGKIGGTLKGRYGIEDYSIVSTPKEMALGDITIKTVKQEAVKDGE